MTRTFVFNGPAETLRVLDTELQRGKQFQTDNTHLIGLLTTLEEVEEVKPDKRETKSRHSDAERS